jgi:membrane protein YqaA with SNARE-associated domain
MKSETDDQIREAIRETRQLESEKTFLSPAVPVAETPEIPVLRIAVVLVIFYCIAFGVRIFFVQGPSFLSLIKHFAKPGSTIPNSPSIFYDYFLYMCLACQFFPIPTIPPIAFTAKAFHPALVAFAGGIGTSIANLNDYAIVGWLFRSRRVKKVRDFSAYQRLLRFFDRYAFATLTVATFLPIPIDVIRMLAISRAYPIWKYMAATFSGRFPRYLILAYLGKELPVKYILILFLVSVVPALVKFISDMMRKRKDEPLNANDR